MDTDPDEVVRLKRELERWRRLFVLGDIDEERFRKETGHLRTRLGELERPREVVHVETAAAYLRDVGGLWAASPRKLQREFVREVFQRIEVQGPQVLSITPSSLRASFRR